MAFYLRKGGKIHITLKVNLFLSISMAVYLNKAVLGLKYNKGG